MQLDTLSKDDRAKIAVHLRRFTAALEHQRRFDREVAASVGRLMRDANFLARINQLLLSKRTSHVLNGSHRERQARSIRAR